MRHQILNRLLLVFFLGTVVFSCEPRKKPKAPFVAEAFVPPYTLSVPENWTTETFGITIEFAPSIPYTGVEDLRFAPGWDNSASEDYWTYCYLWYLDGKTTVDAKTLKENMEAYYTGLVGRNIDKRKIPKEKLFPVKASFGEVTTLPGDRVSFKGSVDMLDYMAQQPIKLNFYVHVKECPGKDNTFVFFEISPKDDTHPVWNTLHQIWTDFKCDVK